MENGCRQKLGKHKLEVLTVLLCSVLVTSAFAITILWSAPAGATITVSVQNIEVLDNEGNPVTLIDFGSLNPSSSISIPLVIKNTSPNASITMSWSSTISSATGGKITNYWSHDGGYSLQPFTLTPGQSVNTAYVITVAADCGLQTWSWTLSIIPG